MNNAINEFKNALEGTNSRIMEVEDRMIEISESGKKKNELKEMRTISETSGTMLNA